MISDQLSKDYISIGSQLNVPLGRNLTDNSRTLAPSKGAIAYDLTTNELYYSDGKDWISTGSDGIALPVDGVDAYGIQVDNITGALNLEFANQNYPGIVSIDDQSFSGTKNFDDITAHTLNNTNNVGQIIIGNPLTVVDFNGSTVTGIPASLIYAADPPTVATDNNGIIINNILSKINLEFADGTHNGILSTTNQTIAGDKTFSDNVNVSGNIDIVGQLSVDNITEHTLNAGIDFNDVDIKNFTGGIADNIQIGINTMNTLGNHSIAIGPNSQSSNTASSNNVTIGYNTMTGVGNGVNNTIVGTFAGENLTNGLQNCALGFSSLRNVTTGTNNISIGTDSGTLLNSNESNDILIGHTGVTGESNTIRLGTSGTHTTNFQAGINGVTTGGTVLPVFVNNSNQLGTLNYTFPSAPETIVGRTSVDTLTNKTLTSPVISTIVNVGTLTLPTSTDTLVGRNTTDTLTNKTISTATNTITTATTVNSGIVSTTTQQFGGYKQFQQITCPLPTVANNTSFGDNALAGITSGTLNSAFGTNSLQNDTSGSSNVAVGRNSLQSNINGSSNTAIGTGTLALNTAGSNNVAVGTGVLALSTADNNVGVGSSALAVATGGGGHTAVGRGALTACASAFTNTCIGFEAGKAITSGSFNVALGNALTSNVGGDYNVGVGHGALRNTTVSSAVAMGRDALGSLTSGSANIAIGASAGTLITTGQSNVIYGPSAMNNTATGVSFNVAIGHNALSTTTSNNNIAVGYNALNISTSGGQNTAVGTSALAINTTGQNNVAFGFNSLTANVSSDNNTGLGYGSLTSNTGTNNIGIGFNGGMNLTTGSNNIAIGHGGVAAESNVIRLGVSGTQTSNIQAGIRGATTGVADAIPVLIDSTGQLGTISSDVRLKTNITDDFGDIQHIIKTLRPIKYSDATDKTNKLICGYLAHEFKQVIPEYVVQYFATPDKIDNNDNFDTIQYQYIPMLLHKEIQRMNLVIEKLTDIISKQATDIIELKNSIKS